MWYSRAMQDSAPIAPEARIRRRNVLVIGSGAAGLAAAVRLHALGVTDVAVYTEGLDAGTSINTGSDKQTYYKLSLDGAAGDSPAAMARDLAAGGAVHGDLALVEAALSPVAFSYLVALGVDFPRDRYGQHPGYRTDHDARARATSAGPYTSRDMCRALIAEARRRGVEFHEPRVAVALLTAPDAAASSGRRCAGAVFADPLTGAFEAVTSRATVFATGGPGGLYGRSVYPACQTGGIGLALLAGAEARNLAESQFGLASTAFRWNVSGSYMQAVPRLFSLDEAGVEREFLTERLGSPSAAADLLFLKGYQWPFSAGNARRSSLVDIFVHIETAQLGRRVFLDYRRNPAGLDLADLGAEARDYLERSGAADSSSPLARLLAMNPGAVQLYRDHGIDLASEPLEVAVSAQHSNGGLAGDLWWQSTNLPGLFPVGEVNGSHGIVRPGGSALNAGQVGAWRAAEHIAATRPPVKGERCRLEADETAPLTPAPTAALPTCAAGPLRACAEKACAEAALAALDADRARPAALRWREVRARIQARMDRAGAFLRRRDELARAAHEARAELRAVLDDGLGGLDAFDAAEALRNRSLAAAHLAYLESCRVQLDRSGSRGGSLAVDPSGERLSPLLPPEWAILPENPAARAETTVCAIALDGAFSFRFEPCRPVPTTDNWFETAWRDHREGTNHRASRNT